MAGKSIEIEQKDLPGGTTGFFAKIKGNIVGSAFVGPEEPCFNIQVNPTHRGEGIGTELLDHVKVKLSSGAKTKFGPEPGNDENLRRFYERNEFIVEGDQVIKK